jgi:hypothetical protein
MGGQMWQLLEAQAEALGEGTQFRRFRGIAEGLSKAIGEEVDTEKVRQVFGEILTQRNPSDVLLTRRELMERWRVSKHIVKRYEDTGMPIAMMVGGRPRYDWEEVEKWREEALRKGKGSEAGTGDYGPGTRRVGSGRLASPGRRRTGAWTPPGRRQKLDLLDSYGNSTKARRQTL